MIKGLTRAGIGDAGSIQQFIKLAAENGFGAVDSGGNELEEWISSAGIDGVNSYLQEHQVIIGTIGLDVEWRQSDEQFRQSLSKLARHAEVAAAAGCENCCTYILPSTDFPTAPFTISATRRLKTCAQILDAYGLRLGLEFVGPHHLRSRWKNPFIWDMKDTLNWIDAIDERNVGLLFDCFHWHTTESTYEDILSLKPSQIVHVHINDARNVPISEVLDNDRLFPGEGVIDFQSFLGGLQQIGYKGVISQEILTQEKPQESAETLIRKSAEAYRKVFTAAGLKNN